MKQLLREWAMSADEYIRANAIRAEASIASLGLHSRVSFSRPSLRDLISVELKGGKFAEGVYLLYPVPASAESSNAAVPSKSFQPEFDIVFIHGVGGDP